MWWKVMGTVPATDTLRLLPEVMELAEQRAGGAGVQDVLPGHVCVDEGVVHMSQQPVWSQLHATVSRRR